ncbi:MAG: aspartate dehydrogenase [Pseudomonadota bacterium]|nr:aspartate dehydrogenase [Pseudomonadota bacterium]
MQENILLIGLGAIGLEVTRQLKNDASSKIRQIIVKPGREAEAQAKVSRSIKVISKIENVDPKPDFVLECAGHQAVSQFGPYFLENGIDLGVISIGAFSDPKLFKRLQESSRKGDSQLSIIPGSIGGLDALSAARSDGLEKVDYLSRKPPLSWVDTPAEKLFDLATIDEEVIIFNGDARRASKLYPKNANVASSIALAGIGFDKTQVILMADPKAKGNVHHIRATGKFGELDIRIVGSPMPQNPKTSALTALSAIREIRNRCHHIKT